MKTALLLLFCCSSCLLSAAQHAQVDLSLQPYIAGDSGNARCWLVTVHKDSVAAFLTNHARSIARRLSANDFILSVQTNAALLASPAVTAFYPANNNWKLSPGLLKVKALLTAKENSAHNFYVQYRDVNNITKNILAQDAVKIVHTYKNLLQIRAGWDFVQKNILPDESVTFIDLVSVPAKEELSVANFDNSLNTVNILHNDYPALDGKNTVVAVKENKPDEADIDLKGRLIFTTASSNTLSTHASTMSTIIAGAGNSFYTARGVAPAAQISSSSFAVLLPEADAFYQQYKISVQNHSYGTGIENFYGADAAAYDASMNSNPSLLHVFSAGNSGNQTPANGPYAGINGFTNLTGSFKMAKNILTVGSVDSFGTVALLSSKGPAYDGRVKPELVAFGEDGSSGAAALVSGTALVLQQAYKELHAGALPDAALIKAILLNTAAPVQGSGLSFSSGYGNLDAYRAARQVKSGQFFAASLAQAQDQSFTIAPPANATNLKILLAWTDTPAAPNAFTALVNDLDLTVTHNASAQQWLPWVVNSYPHKDSLQLPATRRKDSLNSVEQVTIGNPPGGNYTITVHGSRIPAGTQQFFVVYQWDTAATFHWTYPTKNDNLLPGKQQVPRWQSSYTGNGLLEYKYAGSNNWQTIYTTAPLAANYSKWLTPDTSVVALLRMSIIGRQYTSDSFTLSAPLQMGVGFDCPDTALLFWKRDSAAGSYAVSRLGDQYMELQALVSDTAVFISKQTTTAHWFSAAPLLPFNKTGIHSQAIDYTTQGIACWLSSFTADLAGNRASLALTLGTLFRVQRVLVEKMDGNGVYQTLQTYTAPIQLQYNSTDNTLAKGVNQYRVRIELSTGQIIYSNAEQVVYLAGNDYIVYPNPVRRPLPINIVTGDLGNQVMQMYNVFGQLAATQKMTNLSTQMTSSRLAKGIYFYTILKEGKIAAKGKLVVQ